MSFDFDDNLKATKRKNTNPIRMTNLLIVGGFVFLAVLIVVLMMPQSASVNPISNGDIDATVDARIAEYITNQPAQSVEQQETGSAPLSFDAPTLEPRPLIKDQHLLTNTVANGTLTDEAFAIDYTYDGKAGVPIVVTMRGDTLTSPALVLSHPNGERMVSSIASEQIINRETIQVIAVILPTDGQYIITATRKGGRAGDAQGDFTLTVDVPKSLDTSSTITSTITSDSWDWYFVESEEPFTVVYQHESGAFKPELTVYTLNRRMELIEQGYLPDGQLTYGVIGYFESDTVHFVAVGQPTHRRYDLATNTIGSYKIGVRLAQ